MYDVLVVGAGPAGAGTAIRLAEHGLRVLLLEKEHFPRYKACGGGVDGIAARALAAMGIDLGAVEEDAPTELCVTSEGFHPTTYRFDKPLARMTMRSDLDELIARKAVARGAAFRDGERVMAVRDAGQGVVVETGGGFYEGRVLVGADGVYSPVARSFRLNENPILYVLREAEVEVGPEVQAAWAGRAQIDISIWPLGYSWIFPKRSHLSIGAGVPRRYAKGLRVCFERFRQRSNLDGARTLEQRSHMIAFRRARSAIALDRVLLVGDAAGLVDPNTGGGIGWALRSAELAARAILAYLNGETGSLQSYQALVDAELTPAFRAARVLRNAILLRFAITRGRATSHRPLWHEAVRVIQGEEDYHEWYGHSKLAKLLAWTAVIPL